MMKESSIVLRIINTVIFAYLLAPVVIVIAMAFNSEPTLAFPPHGFSLKWFGQFFHDQALLSALVTSLEIAIGACSISLVLGTCAAFGLDRGTFPGKSAITNLLMTPLMVPGIVIGVALLQYFATFNASSFLSLLAGHVVVTLPYVVRSMLAGLSGMDPFAEQAAVSLGATRFAAIRMITIPMLTNSVIAAVLFSFIVSFENLSLALFLSNPETVTLPTQIYSYIQWVFDPTVAAASAIQVLVVVAMVFLAERTAGLSRFMGVMK